LLAGFNNPLLYLFDPEKEKEGILQVRFALPYSDLTSLTEEERHRYYGEDAALDFGHTLGEQIGGQIKAGFVISGFYEDIFPGVLISNYISSFIATRAVKAGLSDLVIEPPNLPSGPEGLQGRRPIIQSSDLSISRSSVNGLPNRLSEAIEERGRRG
jgi:hypothetical protein